MSSTNTCLTSFEIIQNWRTVTLTEKFLDEIHQNLTTETAEALLADHNEMTDDFYDAQCDLEEDSFVDLFATDAQNEAKNKSKIDDSTSSFINVDDAQFESTNLNKSTIIPTTTSSKLVLSDDQIIALADAIQVQFPGTPKNVSAGFYTIKKNKNESDIDFALRRLASIQPPLLYQDNPLNHKHRATIDAINKWHEAADFSAKNTHTPNEEIESYKRHKIDVALAATSYFHDNEHNRLIIRHTPLDTIDADTTARSKETFDNITAHLINHVTHGNQEKEERLKTHHIIPTIEKISFLKEFHIVLTLADQWYEDGEWKFHYAILDSKESMLFLSDFKEFAVYHLTNKKHPPCRYYLEVQKFLNTTDCGKHVTVEANVTLELLIDCPDLTIKKMTLSDFEYFKKKITEGAAHQKIPEFKELLESTKEQADLRKQTRTQAMQPKKPVCDNKEKIETTSNAKVIAATRMNIQLKKSATTNINQKLSRTSSNFFGESHRIRHINGASYSLDIETTNSHSLPVFSIGDSHKQF